MAFPGFVMKLCTFCYKSVSLCENNDNPENAELCSKFHKCLHGFVKVNPPSHSTSCNIVGCKDCKFLIKEFCEVDYRIKCLELELQWKLESLVKVMKLADRVPSRIKLLKQCFSKLETGSEFCDVDEAKSLQGSHNVVDLITYEIYKRFRDQIMKKCHQGRTFSLLQPRVLLHHVKPNVQTEHSEDTSHTRVNSNTADFDEPSFDTDNTEVGKSGEILNCVTTTLSYNSDQDTGKDDDEKCRILDLKYNSFTHDTQEYDTRSSISASSHETVQVKREPIVYLNTDNLIRQTFSINNSISFPCKLCTVKCKSESGLKCHIKRKHYRFRGNQFKQTLKFRCVVCKTSYRTYQDLRRHKVSAMHNFLEKRLLRSNKNERTFAVDSKFPDSMDTSKLSSSSKISQVDHEENKLKHYSLRVKQPKLYNSNNEELDPLISDSDKDYSENTDSNYSSSSEDHYSKDYTENDNLSINNNDNENEKKIKICNQSQRYYRCFLDDCKHKRIYFIKKINFEQHKKFHMRGQYQCNFCDKVEKTIIGLSFHETEMHSDIPTTSTGKSNTNNMFYCARCPLKFQKERMYVKHFAYVHLGITPDLERRKFLWECEICKRKFAQSKNRITSHFKTYHDTSGLQYPDNDIKRCSEENCIAYFLCNGQLQIHKKLQHSSTNIFTKEIDDLIQVNERQDVISVHCA